MDLDELISLGIPKARGNKRADNPMFYVRDLGEADVPMLLEPPHMGTTMRPLVKLRNTHHMLARVLGMGRNDTEASLVTGYSVGRISLLRQDPAFQELMTYYATQTEVKYLDVHERLATLGLSTLDELQERLESDPDGFKNRELMELAEFALDRSVTKDAKKNMPGGAPSVAITFVNGASPEQITADIVDVSFTEVDKG